MSAGFTAEKLETAGKRNHFIGGSFAPNGSSAVDPTTIKGQLVASVTRVSAGLFEVTLRIGVKDVISIVPSTQVNSAATVDVYAQTGAVTITAGPLVFRIHIKTGGTDTDFPAFDASNRVNFLVLAQLGALKG